MKPDSNDELNVRRLTSEELLKGATRHPFEHIRLVREALADAAPPPECGSHLGVMVLMALYGFIVGFAVAFLFKPGVFC
jgi:hypothetical protein